MKTLKLLALGIILFVSSSIHAQISVSLNIGTAPAWGPVGYSDVDYYYLPDVEAYYDIRATQFIYFNGGRWIRSRYLPGQYRNYDLYSGYKVVLNDYHGSRPYHNYRNDRIKYYRGYQGRQQRNIGYRNNDRREYENSGNYENQRHDNREYEGRENNGNEGRGNNGHGNGHGRGHGRD
ncbi:hypothetical protein ACFX5D_14770 [Flavobacterium sp. LB3P45]|uniref:Uncharacterized protein n=1 Tax=Flavobacterium fructosi TaxID=3230416 RepID=A0ABW6HQA9_9FLAO